MSRNGIDIAGEIDAVCDILRRGNCVGALQYIPELTWILFLRMLDEREIREKEDADAQGMNVSLTLKSPFRWQDWASPEGKKRAALTEGRTGAFFAFVRDELFPHMRELKNRRGATPRQKALSEIIIGTRGPRIDTERNLLDVLDRVDKLREGEMDTQSAFPISRVYEELLLKMGEHANDAGQFFTPRDVIRAMVRVVGPEAKDTVLDPCCGTGGFLAQTLESILESGKGLPTELAAAAESRLYGREKENLIYPLALANLILHGVRRPNIWHGNTLTGQVEYDGLFQDAPDVYNVVLTNPPFGGREGRDVGRNYDISSNSTQVLFMQEVMNSLHDRGRCGVVLDEGFMFGLSDKALVQVKRNLLSECDLWCVVSLAPGVFASAGAGVKTNLLFFRKGRPTGRIWYYELYPPKWTDRKGVVRAGTRFTLKYTLTLEHFEEFFGLLDAAQKRGGKWADGPRSWTVDFAGLKEEAEKNAEVHREEASRLRSEEAGVTREMARTRENRPVDSDKIAELRKKRAALEKQAKQADKQADEVENAVYDLRALNPHKKADVDTRTPKQLLGIISDKQREIGKLLAELEKNGE